MSVSVTTEHSDHCQRMTAEYVVLRDRATNIERSFGRRSAIQMSNAADSCLKEQIMVCAAECRVTGVIVTDRP